MRPSDFEILGLLAEGLDDDDESIYLQGDEDDYYVGAAPRRRSRVRARRRSTVKRAARSLVNPIPGVQRTDLLGQPMGFPTIQFANGGATTLTSTSRPQKPFRGLRLVIELARTSGAPELVTLDRIDLGTSFQAVNTNPLPAGAFAPNAFGVGLNMVPIQPGIDAVLQFSVSAAPGVGETIDVQPMIIGYTMT